MTHIALKDLSESKILIRAANWVGDAIMTTPVIRAVRKNYPKSLITVLAKPWVIPVYEHNPYIDHIMVYQNNGRHKKGFGTITLVKDIRKAHFDLAILMQNAFEAALITFLGRVRERLGYDTDARFFLLNRAVKLDPQLKKGHLIDYYIGILQGADICTDGRQLDLFLSDADRQFAHSFLQKNNLQNTSPVLAINPGATGGTAKRWPPQSYAILARMLADKIKTKILIFGGPGDRELGEQINAESHDSCINIAGQTTLGQAFALIEACDLFITNDSGLMHAAAALNINQVAIIGPTNYLATSPANENSTILRIPVPCSPCMKPECPIDHKCMNLITVDMVYQKVLELLNG